MEKICEFIKKYMVNKYVMFFVFFVFFKPYFLGINRLVNLAFNGLMMLLALVVYFISFYKNKPSKLQFAILGYMAVCLLSTFLVSKDFSFWFKFFMQYSSISLYSEFVIKNNLKQFLKTLSFLLWVLIFANFAALLMYPEGIFKAEVLLLGYDNATIVTLILGTMFICFKSYYFYKRMDFWAITSLFMVFGTYLIRWSVGAIIGCGVVLSFFLFFYKRDIFVKFFNIKTFFILAFSLFLAIVVFDIQNYFSYIIVDIFGKNLTLTGRIYIWERCFNQIQSHLLFGIGMMEYSVRYELIRIYHAHSNFLNVILETGIVGLIAYFYLWSLPMKSLMKDKFHELSKILNFALFSFLVMTLVDVIDNSEVLYVFFNVAYFLPGIISSLENKDSNKKHVLVVLDSGQPLPAVKGGAVETLIDSYLIHNEESKEFIYDVYSTYDKALKYNKQEFKYTNFYYIKKDKLIFQLKRIVKMIVQKVTRKPIESIFSYELLNEIEVYNKNNYYDLVIVENAPSIILNLKKKIQSKYILHLHNDINIIKHYNNCLIKYDLIISCSNYIKNRVESEYPAAEVLNVYNGLNEHNLLKYDSIREKVRRKYKFSSKDIVFGYCGRICEEKGVKELCSAFKSAYKKNSNCKLLIVGSSFFKDSKPTPYVREIVEMMQDVKNAVVFMGYVDHEKIGSFYTAIDVLVVPSIVNEACPLTVLEAMIMKKPLIGTKSGGIPELVNEKNAILVDKKDLEKELSAAMYVLSKKADVLKKMGEVSAKLSQKFYEQNYLENFTKAISDVLKD